MGPVEKTVRVFISSTFRDMHAERDHLVTVVFPELRERLERLGLELYDVDLRWGVPEKKKGAVDGEKANSWAYCKQWIERVEPFFISLLGQRYGWIPPTSEIRDENDLVAYQGLSITEMEIRYAVFSGKLHKRNFFYFRQTVVPENAPPNIYKEFVDLDEQESLRRLKNEIVVAGQPVRRYDCRWTGAGFANLDTFGRVVLEDLWSDVLRDERYVPQAAWQEALGHNPRGSPLYSDRSEPIPPEVWQKIVAAAKPPPRDAESEQMATFAAAHLRRFRGRKSELKQLSAFIENDQPAEASRVCVVRAAAGQGKSALLAKLAEQLTNSAHLVITHFIGVTEHGTDARSLLERLDQGLERVGISAPEEKEPEQNSENLRKRFAARLENYNGQCRLVLLIDALNQMSDGYDLSWLPRQLAPSVRIILSIIDDSTAAPESAEARVLAALRARMPQPQWVEVAPLDESDVRGIVGDYLIEYYKELDAAQIEIICKMEQTRNPLYLLVMLNELRVLGGNDMNKIVPQLIAEMKEKYPDTVALFDWVLERLEVFGKETAKLWCIYLALGRVGMSSRELSDLLARKFGADAAHTSLLIERGLRRYLQKRGPQLDFFHGQLRQAVQRRYLLEEATPYHADIAAYLETRWRQPDAHALSELPYHLANAGANEAENLISTLSDLAFIDAKCRAERVYELLEDFDLPAGNNTRIALLPVRKAVVQSLEAIINRPHLTLQTVYNYLVWQNPSSAVITASLDRAKNELDKNSCWIRSSAPLPDHLSTADWRVDFDFSSSIQSLSSDRSHMAISGPEGELIVHNLLYGKPVDHRQLDCEQIRSIAIAENPRRFAWVDQQNKIHSSFSLSTATVYTSEINILYHPEGGIIFVNADSSLVCWKPEQQKTMIICEGFPTPTQILRFTHDERYVVYAAGNSPSFIGIIEWNGNEWKNTHIPFAGVPIVDLDYDPETRNFAILQKNRCISIMNMNQKGLLRQNFYEVESHGQILGAPVRCAIGNQELSNHVFFCTHDGQIGIWDWQNGSLGIYADCFSRSNLQSFRYLVTMPGTDKLFFSTNGKGGVVSKQTKDSVLAFHQSEVLDCVITASNHVVSAGKHDNKLKWFAADGLNLLGERIVHDISAIGPSEEGDQVLIGDRYGRVWIQGPDKEPSEEERLPIFVTEVKGILPSGPGNVIAADKGGTVRLVNLTNHSVKEYRHYSGVGKLFKLLPAGPNGLFWAACEETEKADVYMDIELWKPEGKEAFYHSRHMPDDINISLDGSSICLVGNKVEIYVKGDGGWKLSAQSIRSLNDKKMISFLGSDNGMLAVLFNNSSWLEIWSTSRNLEKIAEVLIPETVTCLTVSGDYIVLGCQSGQLISYHLERK
jgi:hypothetical protein